MPFGDRFGDPSGLTVATNPSRCSVTTRTMSASSSVILELRLDRPDVDPPALVAGEPAQLVERARPPPPLVVGPELDLALLVEQPARDRRQHLEPRPRLAGHEADLRRAGDGMPGPQEVRLVLEHERGVPGPHEPLGGGRRPGVLHHRSAAPTEHGSGSARAGHVVVHGGAYSRSTRGGRPRGSTTR